MADIYLNLGKGPCTSASSGVRGGVARVPVRGGVARVAVRGGLAKVPEKSV